MNVDDFKTRLKIRRNDIREKINKANDDISVNSMNLLDIGDGFFARFRNKNRILEWQESLKKSKNLKDKLLDMERTLTYMIEALDNEEVKKPIELKRVLDVFKMLNLSGSEAISIFGKFAFAINRFYGVLRYRYLCEADGDILWEQIFNKDGSFRIELLTGEVEKQFGIVMQAIDTDKWDYIWRNFKNSLNIIMSINQEEAKKENVLEDNEDYQENEDADSLLLRKYYSNYRLLHEPTEEEIEEILQILENSSMDINEKRYVIRLLNEQRKEVIEENVETVSSSEEQVDCILFLGGVNRPYLLEDIDNIDKGLRSRFKTLLDYKINSKKRSFFRRVITAEKLEYPIYWVSNNVVTVFFVEVRVGLYIIVGGSLSRNGYDEMIKRVKATTLEIKSLVDIFDNGDRKQLILEHNKLYSSLSAYLESGDILQRKMNRK